MQNTSERKDVYTRIAAQIVEHLEKGVRPWIRPWNAEHAAGRITRAHYVTTANPIPE
jgi:antirestriction protein ArdC